jgi:hypothetical protein
MKFKPNSKEEFPLFTGWTEDLWTESEARIWAAYVRYGMVYCWTPDLIFADIMALKIIWFSSAVINVTT